MPNQIVNRPPKMTTDRLKMLDYYVAGIDVFKPKLLTASGGPLAGPPMAGMLAGARQGLVNLGDALGHVSRELVHMGAMETQLIRKRDDAKEDLYDTTVAMRGAYAYTFGVDELLALGFARTTPESTEPLLEYTLGLGQRLQAPDLAVPSPRFAGIEVDPAEAGRQLTAANRCFDDTVERLGLHRTEMHAAKLRRDEVRKELDEKFPQIAQMVEMMFSLAGLEGLAELFRRSRRRRTSRQKDEELPDLEAALRSEGLAGVAAGVPSHSEMELQAAAGVPSHSGRELQAAIDAPGYSEKELQTETGALSGSERELQAATDDLSRSARELRAALGVASGSAGKLPAATGVPSGSGRELPAADNVLSYPARGLPAARDVPSGSATGSPAAADDQGDSAKEPRARGRRHDRR